MQYIMGVEEVERDALINKIVRISLKVKRMNKKNVIEMHNEIMDGVK